MKVGELCETAEKHSLQHAIVLFLAKLSQVLAKLLSIAKHSIVEVEISLFWSGSIDHFRKQSMAQVISVRDLVATRTYSLFKRAEQFER